MGSGPGSRWLARGLLIIIAGCLALTGFAQATGTAAPAPAFLNQFDPYLHRTNGALADPINLIFVGGSADAAAAALHDVLGFQVVNSSMMIFADQGTLRTTKWQLAIPLTRGDRIHLRIERVPSGRNQPYVLAAVHRDDAEPCGHVGTDFNRERRFVTHGFIAAGYPVTIVQMDNTIAGPQCDGSFTAGDGLIAIINLGQPIQTQ